MKSEPLRWQNLSKLCEMKFDAIILSQNHQAGQPIARFTSAEQIKGTAGLRASIHC